MRERAEQRERKKYLGDKENYMVWSPMIIEIGHRINGEMISDRDEKLVCYSGLTYQHINDVDFDLR